MKYRFATFEIDSELRTLTRDGESFALSAKSFDLLLQLVEHHGSVLSKDELLARVWPDQIVEENNLTVQMSALRKVLGDGSGTRFITTIPGRGYSFAVPVEAVDIDEFVIERRVIERVVVDEAPSDPEPMPHSKRWWPIALVAAAFAMLIGLGIFGWKSSKEAAALPLSSVAVLPFDYEGTSSDSDYLADGVPESLISSLSTLPEISVKARSSSFRYKGAGTGDIKRIGRDLNVGALITGKIAERGDDISIYAELTDVAMDKVLWSQTYRGKQSQLSALQSSLVVDVSTALRLKLSGAETARLKRSYPENSEAYRLYLKGRYFWNKRSISGLKKSVELYDEALKADPNFALAYVGLAESYVIFEPYSVAPARVCMPLAEKAALRALELDDTLSEAHIALGFYLNSYEWKRDEAERKLRRAIELNPSNATAYHWLGDVVLAPQRRFDEAMVNMRKAEELDPLSPAIGMNIGAVMAAQHQFDNAETQIRSVLSRNPEFSVGLITQSFITFRKGDTAAAISQAEQALAIDYDPLGKGYLGRYLARAGRRDEAKKIIGELAKESETVYVTNYAFALVYIGLGDTEKALDSLQKEIDDRGFWANSFAILPELDELRGEPRFKAMLKQLNLPES